MLTHLLLLLPAAKVNLMAGAKRTTNRDFRIRLDAAAGGEGNSGRAGQQQRGQAKKEEQGEEGQGQGGWLCRAGLSAAAARAVWIVCCCL